MLQAARVEDERFNMGSRMRSLGRQQIQVDNILLMRGRLFIQMKYMRTMLRLTNPVMKMLIVLQLIRKMIICFRIAMRCLWQAQKSLLTILELFFILASWILLFIYKASWVNFDSTKCFILIMAIKYHSCIYSVRSYNY